MKPVKEDECKHKNTKTNSNNTSVWNEKVMEIIEIICASLKKSLADICTACFQKYSNVHKIRTVLRISLDLK